MFQEFNLLDCAYGDAEPRAGTATAQGAGQPGDCAGDEILAILGMEHRRDARSRR